jgi:hypothetical protein
MSSPSLLSVDVDLLGLNPYSDRHKHLKDNVPHVGELAANELAANAIVMNLQYR